MWKENDMSYINDICTSLTTVLTHACNASEEYFAGFAANRDFWIAEARHCLEVIDGYQGRFQKMAEGSGSCKPHKVDWPTIPIAKSSMSADDLREARQQVRHGLGASLK